MQCSILLRTLQTMPKPNKRQLELDFTPKLKPLDLADVAWRTGYRGLGLWELNNGGLISAQPSEFSVSVRNRHG